MRRPSTVAVLVAAVVAATAGAALAVLGVPVGETSTAEAVPSARPSADGAGAAASPSAVPIDDTVTADDYCYVGAMIYYRVKEEELAQTLLRKDDLAPAAEAFAKRVVGDDVAELDGLREWYVSWAPARPLEPPTDGPCGGHGSDHAQMPGMPSWSTEQGLVDAQAPDAERRYAEIVGDQTAGMVALVTLILDGDPHPEVRTSAEQVLKRAEADQNTLQQVVDALR